MPLTLSPSALTTVEAVQASGLAPGASEDRIVQLINALSDGFQARVGQLGYAVQTQKYEGSGNYSLWLKRFPVVEVQSVLVDGVAVTDWSAEDEEKARGEIYRDSGWPRECQTYGDLTRDIDSSRARRSITVAYSAGYILPQYADETDAAHNPDGAPANLPADLVEAIHRAIAMDYARPMDIISSEKTPGGLELTYRNSQGTNTTPPPVHPLLVPFLSRFLRDWTY